MIHQERSQESVDPSEHIKLARHLASKALKRFDKKSQTLDHDIYGEAMLGLVLAAKTYDTSQKSFATWAQYKIRGRIKNYIEKECKYRSKRISLDAVINDTEQSDCVNISEDEFLTAQQTNAMNDYMSCSVTSCESESAHEMCEIYEALEHVGGREREIILLRAQGLTLAEIGERFGFSRERIRQIEECGINLVKARVSRNRGEKWA